MKEIVQNGEPVLRDIAKEVPEELFGSAELKTLVKDMELALDQELDGVALAAPQIGVSYRIFIVRKDRTLPSPQNLPKGALPPIPPPEVLVYINPEITKSSGEMVEVDEGCLSVRGIYGTTTRHERMSVRARRVDGSKIEETGTDLMAQIFGHEIDHLNGILFIDHAEHLVRIQKNQTVPYVFFGTPTVASETLAHLLEHTGIPSLIVTSPDAPKGRGLTLTPSPVKAMANALGIPVITPAKLDTDALETIASYACEYAVVVAYGKIFPEALIQSFPRGVLNVHYSLLPKHRGATPLEAALRAGDSETGVTIQKMVKELDAGDIIAQAKTPIGSEETARELRPRLIALGSTLLVGTLDSFISGTIIPEPQDNTLATHCGKLKKEDGLLSLNDPAENNWNKYRAYADSIGTYLFENGKRMKITQASYKNGVFTIERVIPEGKREVAYTTGSQ